MGSNMVSYCFESLVAVRSVNRIRGAAIAQNRGIKVAGLPNSIGKGRRLAPSKGIRAVSGVPASQSEGSWVTAPDWEPTGGEEGVWV